jgi:predicted unusual protein kinase regulating ubiquinone biosynthesis (AarF/ABC1/UbiB family)
MDLHSGNIMFKKKDSGEIFIRLMDFGLAKTCELAERTQSTKAKQEFVSSKSSETS